MTGSLRPRVQLFTQLRSAHLERAHQGPPATVLYRHRRFDFDETLLAGLDVRRAGAAAVARALFSSDVETIEVNEPLMVGSLARTAVGLAALDARRVLRGRRATVVSYAIENRDPFRRPAGAPTPSVRLRAAVRSAAERRLSRFVARRVDRLVYGTPAAQQLYEALLGPQLRRAATRSVLAVSAPCACLAGPEGAEPADPDLVVFLGALSDRKGVRPLMAAWPEVLRLRPATRLALRGSGPLEQQVRGWAADLPGVDVGVGASRDRVHALLRRAAVLVLFSQPSSTWREQVGLPLVEALAHGCAVVTSSETGLAPWLAAHGHRVLPPDAAPAELAAAIVAAVDEARPGAAVLGDLPAEDGRLAADRWLGGDARGGR